MAKQGAKKKTALKFILAVVTVIVLLVAAQGKAEYIDADFKWADYSPLRIEIVLN